MGLTFKIGQGDSKISDPWQVWGLQSHATEIESRGRKTQRLRGFLHQRAAQEQ